jgi:hypothetical protein
MLSDFNEAAFWAMPKVVLNWRRMVELADEITIKEYFHNCYNPLRAAQTKAYAASLGKPVWLHCYLSQGNELNEDFFSAFMNDMDADGLILYEAMHSMDTVERNTGYICLDSTTGKVSLHRPVADRILELRDKYQLSY